MDKSTKYLNAVIYNLIQAITEDKGNLIDESKDIKEI